MVSSRLTNLCRFAAVAGAALALTAASTVDAHTPSRVTATVVSDDLRVSNVTPTWGAQIPKLVYDGAWYYAATLDGEGSQYPWQARVWKSRDGRTWTEAVRLPGHVYQPPGLLVDRLGRLHLQVACYTGGECYPGVAPAPGDELAAVYPVRLIFSALRRDGSVDFSRFTDHTRRAPGSERYYQGLAVDPTGRYIYAAYAVANWDLHVNVFDTWTGRDVHTTKAGSPPPGRAWLYPRVQPGDDPGEIYLSFSQYVLGSPNSAYLDGATLWRSADRGRTFREQTYLTRMPVPDGNQNWVDAGDVTVDPSGGVHAVFFRRDQGVGTLYYQHGIKGTPVAVGALDNHAQIAVRRDGERIVFATEGNHLVVARSDDGRSWRIERHRVPGVSGAFWPNLLQPRSGSRIPAGWDTPQVLRTGMLLAAQRTGSTAYNPLLFVRHDG